jgi:hypothetical protein
MVDTEYQTPSINCSTKPKRFEAKWFLEKDFVEVVKRAWEAAAVANPEGFVGQAGAHAHLTSCMGLGCTSETKKEAEKDPARIGKCSKRSYDR